MNPYEVLMVPEDASSKHIKMNYRKLSAIYHPDTQGTGDNEKFLEIKLAYDVLSNPTRRERYDETGRVDENIINEKRVKGFLINVIRSIASDVSADDPTTTDIVAKIVKSLKTTLKTNEDSIVKDRAIIHRMEQLASRFEVTSDDVEDVVGKTLAKEIKNKKSDILATQDMIELVNRVIKYVRCYNYKVGPDGGTTPEPTTRSRGSDDQLITLLPRPTRSRPESDLDWRRGQSS